jgi:hypothetical protein
MGGENIESLNSFSLPLLVAGMFSYYLPPKKKLIEVSLL